MEYNPGVTKCADCGLSLVHQLPVESHELEYDFLFLIETLNLSDIALIQSVLKGSGIVYHLIGENFNLMRPLVSPARFYVKEDQYEDAKLLLENLNLRYLALSIPEENDPVSD
ncbi:hypothetical protein JW835_16555 [bacterium]|nr:hypothetical protein [bacterium]